MWKKGIGPNLKQTPDLTVRESDQNFIYYFQIFMCHNIIYELKTKYLSEYPNPKLKFEILGHFKKSYPRDRNIFFRYLLQKFL